MEYSHKFKSFFHDFDQRLDELGVQSYGISITTLEEVFLAVGDGRDIGEHAEERTNVRKKILKAQSKRASGRSGHEFSDVEDRHSLL